VYFRGENIKNKYPSALASFIQMNKKTKTIDLGNHQAILDEINALLASANAIDETRAKKVRKATDVLRDSDATPAAGEDAHEEDSGLNAKTDATEEDSGLDAEIDAAEEDSQLDANIDAALEKLRTRIHKQVERRNRDYEKALGLMDEQETALKDNELQQAERAYNKLMSIMGNIPGLSEKRWKDIEKRLNRVRPQLRKLESWRHWGTTQARQTLIQQMTQLTDAGLQPEKLAEQIKQAREQWHAWDKSGDHAGKALWKEFDQACEVAYKPCIAHFEKLKQRRKDNLRLRRAIIDGLNARYASTDWKQPDWREIDKFVNHARRDFYKIGNVDFKHRKPVAMALDEVLEKFEQDLSRERERSMKAREKLIADIEALTEVANLRDALDRLEALKKQWTITVTGKRTHENRLWKRFQAACDSTYRRRDAERKDQAAERNENLQQKQALIEELARTAAAADEELLANVPVLARIRQQWETIGWVPRNQENSLDSQWRNAQKQFSQALKEAKSRAHASELDNIVKHAALCEQTEQAVLAGSALDTAAVEAQRQALPALSAAIAAAMQQRFTQALNRPDDAALSDNLAFKLDACLKLEVLLELESPQECQAERMAYQIERLNSSMKKGPGAQDSPRDLLLAVLASGATPADAAGTIEQRFNDCLARYKSRS
jgi:exonuclease SbcC